MTTGGTTRSSRPAAGRCGSRCGRGEPDRTPPCWSTDREPAGVLRLLLDWPLTRPAPVIRFDLPGIGGSPLTGRSYRLPRLSLHPSPCLSTSSATSGSDVLGIFPWGGALAQQFALTARRRCRTRWCSWPPAPAW
ncbi:hypothetical protein HBB16_03805 [Pseudonocardia sp. MCCB 268]|nr:hypothetical protein [Pseudonocardia cytotoxica]